MLIMGQARQGGGNRFVRTGRLATHGMVTFIAARRCMAGPTSSGHDVGNGTVGAGCPKHNVGVRVGLTYHTNFFTGVM